MGKSSDVFLQEKNKEGKKTKGTKKSVIKKIKFDDYKNCLKASKLVHETKV